MQLKYNDIELNSASQRLMAAHRLTGCNAYCVDGRHAHVVVGLDDRDETEECLRTYFTGLTVLEVRPALEYRHKHIFHNAIDGEVYRPPEEDVDRTRWLIIWRLRDGGVS